MITQIPFALASYGTLFTLEATQFITWGMNVFILRSSGFIAGTLSMFASYFFRTTFYNGTKGKHPVFVNAVKALISAAKMDWIEHREWEPLSP